jgi:hypothetical protein
MRSGVPLGESMVNKKTRLGMTLFFICSSVWADQSVITVKPPRQTNLGSEYQFKIGVQYNHLVEDVGQVVGNEYQADLSYDYASDPEQTYTKNFSLDARINSQDQLMFSLKKAFVDYKFENSALSVGRMPIDWSKVDANWGFGFINNRRNFDYFEPGEEGLIGAWFRKRPASGVQFDAFMSFLYAPETNPGLSVDEETGTLNCENPWCKAPASSVEITPGKVTPIFYEVDYPELSDVVLRYSVGARLAYKINDWEVSGYLIRKPENQISTTAEVVVNVDDNVINAFVTPQFYYQNVYGGRIDYNPSKNWNLYGAIISSTVSDKPDGNIPNINYTELKVEKKDQHYVATGIGAVYDRLKLGLNYIARVSDFDIEEDLLVEYPRWNQAIHAMAAIKLSDKISGMFDYKTDTLTQDRLMLVNVAYQVTPSLSTKGGVRMIGSDERSFWSDFKNNDQVYAGIDMIF